MKSRKKFNNTFNKEKVALELFFVEYGFDIENITDKVKKGITPHDNLDK